MKPNKTIVIDEIITHIEKGCDLLSTLVLSIFDYNTVCENEDAATVVICFQL